MTQVVLLFLATAFYAGYNLFIKVSGNHVSATAETTVSATLVLQLSALFTTTLVAGFLFTRGTNILGLSLRTYFWAALAGVCIGGAEIVYLYIFSGLASGGTKLPANTVIPLVVGGTILLTVIFSAMLLGESFGWTQAVGAAFIIVGVLFLFWDGGALTASLDRQ